MSNVDRYAHCGRPPLGGREGGQEAEGQVSITSASAAATRLNTTAKFKGETYPFIITQIFR